MLTRLRAWRTPYDVAWITTKRVASWLVASDAGDTMAQVMTDGGRRPNSEALRCLWGSRERRALEVHFPAAAAGQHV
jgi:hypothetical protein